MDFYQPITDNDQDAFRELVRNNRDEIGGITQTVICQRKFDLLRILFDEGLDVNQHHNGETPLLLAINTFDDDETVQEKELSLSMIRFLIASGADVNLGSEEDIYPILYACIYNDDRIINHLLANGANLNIVDFNGNTPLHYAVYNNKIEMVNKLISLGVDINAKNVENKTPLFDAVDGNYIDIAKCLIKAGASLKEPENSYFSFIMCAIYNENKEMVDLLLENNVNTDTISSSDLSYNDVSELVKYVRDYIDSSSMIKEPDI